MLSESDVAVSPEDQTAGRTKVRPWLTILITSVCIVLFLGINAEANPNSFDALTRWGWRADSSIWGGSYWALISSALLHVEVWHLAFNLYWFWLLGGLLEQAVGRWRFGGFVVLSAFVSSAFQLALSGDSGIGLSGVVYAIFGCMWVGRTKFPAFNKYIHSRNILLFVGWLFLCILLTYLNIMNIGNEAHIAGLVFGVLIAFGFITHHQRKTSLALSGLFVVFAVVTLFWLPWSARWLGYRAYDAHLNQKYDQAISYYSRVIALEPENGWAFNNRANAYHLAGDDVKAQADALRAYELGAFDPQQEGK
jgi:rhomboid protease GluP